jgi:serine/threonine-protein kinase
MRGLEGRRLAGRYEIREPIGSGGMASVWLGEDSRLARPVAVKLLSEGVADDPAFLVRFRREARVAASLTHPNLVGIYDFEADHDPPFLVMELVPGPDLATRMTNGERVDVRRLAADLLSALDAIHRAGVIHRDVKPQNVLIAADGRAQLTDFGIARRAEATSITQTGQMPGTARYMAPELMHGEPASPASDLYSCGVVLRDCLAAQPAEGPVTSLAARLCNPDPARRPESASTALVELGARSPDAVAEPTAATQVQVPERPAPTAPAPFPAAHEASQRAARRPSSQALVAMGALVGLVALVAVLIASSGGDGGSDGGGALLGREDGGEQAPEADGEQGGPARDPGPSPSADGVPNNPARGEALDAEGKALIDSGQPEEAIPVLERAVASFPEGADDIRYAYALFNLGNALRLAGRPDEAVPILRERLRYEDQLPEVRAELAAARAEAAAE